LRKGKEVKEVKRIITVVVAALVMAAIMLVMVAPAMAFPNNCGPGEKAKPDPPPRNIIDDTPGYTCVPR
jgi:hypothetical protein